MQMYYMHVMWKYCVPRHEINRKQHWRFEKGNAIAFT